MINAKFIPEAHIERAAMELLAAYGKKYGEVTEPPIPVDEILECQLNLSLRFKDLAQHYGRNDMLGATWIDKKIVVIDQSLEPDDNPKMRGRYRFTVAHEVGHWVLHREQLLAARSAPLLNQAPEPSIICRTADRKLPVETQADRFAGFLLMPEEMVRCQWREIAGSDDPYVAEEEIAWLESQSDRVGGGQPTVELARWMADAFHVSGQAMQIRLVNLKLILPKKPPASLFG